MKVFDDLVSKGIKKVMLVSGNFPSMNDAEKLAYPEAEHQLFGIKCVLDTGKVKRKKQEKSYIENQRCGI